MKTKIIAGIVILAVAAGGGWWWRSRSAATAANAKNQPQYVMAKVQKGDIRSTIAGTGPVASVNGVSVKAGQTGTVKQILAQDGDRVKRGQVIMILENPSLAASLQQAENDLKNTHTSLNNLLNPQDTAVRAQQLKVENARITLEQRKADLANLTVTAPQAGVVTGISTTEGSSVNNGALLITLFDDSSLTFVAALPQQAATLLPVGLKVPVELPGFGVLTGEVIQSGGAATPAAGNRDASVPVSLKLPPTEGIRPGMVGQAAFTAPGSDLAVNVSGSVKNVPVEVRAKVAGTVAQLAVAEGARVKAGDLLVKLSSDTVPLQARQAENDLQAQEQALLNLIDPDRDPSGQATTLRQKLEQQQITLSTRRTEVADLEVKAPVDGLVSQLTVKVGDKIANNQALFRVADYSAMQVTIAVDELDIAKVQPAQQATIQLDALPGKTYRGKVTKINPEGIFKNDIATFEVTVGIENAQGLMAGMNSNVTVVVENKPGVLWLPAQAVTVRQGRATVQIKSGDSVSPKEIQIGVRTAQQVEVTGGLAEGDEVVLTVVNPSSGGIPGMGGGMPFGGGQRQQSTPATAPTGGTTPRVPGR